MKSDLPDRLLTQFGPDTFYLAAYEQPWPRIQLFSKGRAVDNKEVAEGHYGVPGEPATDIGPSIDLLFLARRPMALDTTGDTTAAFYDPETPEYQRVKYQAGCKDGGCMYGVSFLVLERSTEQIYEFYCGTKSSRVVAVALAEYLPLTPADIEARGLKCKPRPPRAATLTSAIEKRGKWSWHVPVADASSWAPRMPSGTASEVQRFIGMCVG